MLRRGVRGLELLSALSGPITFYSVFFLAYLDVSAAAGMSTVEREYVRHVSSNNKCNPKPKQIKKI